MQRLLSFFLCVLGLCFMSSSFAAPRHIEHFESTTWAKLQAELSRPAVVVFTATYCSNCPALIEKIAQRLKKQGIQKTIVAVVIDEATDEDLLKSDHYRSVDRLFVFNGDETRLRYGVDPRWRGLTPYVALFPRLGNAVFVAGTPTDAQFAEWLRRLSR